MRRCGIADLINGVYNGIEGGIHANTHICAKNIIVNAGRHAHHRDALLGQDLSAVQRAISTGNDHCIHTGIVDLPHCLTLTGGFAEFFAARGLQNSAATL
ncbi:hypothetical protein SDC9_173363 [bioreactor metagenome]|uniref:Uncharacterized protein n=1 Tax=bioreactor metagenome TaxID=1076179 RepID=A0A645GJ71_9ZZZZ